MHEGYAQHVRDAIMICKNIAVNDEGELVEMKQDLNLFNPSAILEVMLKESMKLAAIDNMKEEMDKELFNIEVADMGKDRVDASSPNFGELPSPVGEMRPAPSHHNFEPIGMKPKESKMARRQKEVLEAEYIPKGKGFNE